MDVYDQELKLEAPPFQKVREDANDILQRLIRSMAEKNSLNGTLTIKIGLSLSKDSITTMVDGQVAGKKDVLIPNIEHNIGYSMKIEGKIRGEANFSDMELAYDEDTGEYVLKPIANTEQGSIFDDQFNPPEPLAIEQKTVEEVPDDNMAEDPEEWDYAEDLSDEF